MFVKYCTTYVFLCYNTVEWVETSPLNAMAFFKDTTFSIFYALDIQASKMSWIQSSVKGKKCIPLKFQFKLFTSMKILI